ncbi:MAG TPA: hypothetical protein VLG40_00050 [Candidatus Saccharimonas sp.]|nr:hypothetical protein [Candidatus Saccharimonas sp.]
MQKLERWLNSIFVTKAPYTISQSGRQSLVSAMPWIALAAGAVMVWIAYLAWQALAFVGHFSAVANDLAQSLYGRPYAQYHDLSFLLWVALVVLIVEAVLFFVAYPNLRDRKKFGWNLVFWVALINIAEAVLQVVATGDVLGFTGQLLGSVVGLYLLFQMRAMYLPTAPPSARNGKANK